MIPRSAVGLGPPERQKCKFTESWRCAEAVSTLGRALRTARLLRALSQEQLAEAGDFDQGRTLTLISRQLKDAGFRRMTTRSLKTTHGEALLRRWLAEGLSAGPITWAPRTVLITAPGTAGALPE